MLNFATSKPGHLMVVSYSWFEYGTFKYGESERDNARVIRSDSL